MSQLPLFTEAKIVFCEHEEKYSIKRGEGFDLMRCQDCGEDFYAVYSWDGTESGAYNPVCSIPLFQEIDPDEAVFFLFCLSVSGWKTTERGLVTQYGGTANEKQALKSCLKYGILLPF